jgi:hypothetical protein
MLEPHSTKRYHTYITHPWIVREVNSGTRMLLSGRPAVVGMSHEQAVEVQAPPELTWSVSWHRVLCVFKCSGFGHAICGQHPAHCFFSQLGAIVLLLMHAVCTACPLQLETHSCFPDPFKQSVKALLLAHKKLEQCSGTAYQQPSHLASFCHEDDRSCTSKKRAWSGIDPPGTAMPMPSRTCLLVSLTGAADAAADLALTPKTGHVSLMVPPMLPHKRSLNNSTGAPATPHSHSFTELSTTNLHISTDSSSCSATLTVMSPKRSRVAHTFDIAVNAAVGGSTTSLNIAHLLGSSTRDAIADCAMAADACAVVAQPAAAGSGNLPASGSKQKRKSSTACCSSKPCHMLQ